MRTYLSTLHTRSHRHKKNFALLVSGTFTVLIFTLWSFVHFSGSDTTAAAANALTPVTAPVTPAPQNQSSLSAESPFSSLKETFSNSISSFKQAIGEAKQGLSQVDLNQDYAKVRNQALSNQPQQ